ncbi:LamG-like jellyroll fold domain-containing protein [Aerosakkonema funiforme]|uniref:Carboxypeptidase regulatory-like domain-containing protein n=1 Tax=Aerosakkonema funiforme FACHB-1375 TaxID=2949571 RepID=A0A926ZJ53_9CYAN|nr:LamG-like jellyroll fold domain-containing protein [Aerosakkonema funiforme]MBD2184314.1 carboxypeptidase regulatory-like domain-containing protein [Aerosakkonema funiforme FACHB-1375]
MTNPTKSLQPVLLFDGQNNAINLGKKPQFKIEKAITLEAWICVTAQKKYAGIISNIFKAGATESGYGLLLDGESGIYFGLKVPSAGIQYLSSGANTITLNKWHHIAGTYDGQEMKLYVDGVEKAKQVYAGNNINYNPENNLLFGMYKDNNASLAFPGKIAEIRIWKITRTQPEIQNNFSQRLTGNESGLVGYWPLNEGSNNIAHDRTTKTNHGVINGASWEQAQVPLTKQPVITFNGQDNAIDLGKKPQFKIEKAITLEAWICVASQKGYAGIISNIYDTGTTESGYGLLLDGYSGIYFGLKVPALGIQYLSSGANTITLNKWHHIAGTYDGQEMKLYVDGIEKAKQVYAGNNINYNPENDLLLGMFKDNDEVYAFAGKIAEIRLWKITRTQPEIQNNLSQRLTGNESGLVGYWPLNESSNNIAYDRTKNTNHGVIYGANWEQSQVPLTKQPVLTFNGQDNAIDLGKKPQFKIEKAITLEAWICVTSQKGYAGIISNIYDTGTTESGYGLLLDGYTGIYFGLKVPALGIQYLSSGANTITLNKWHHIAGTYDGQEMKLYVDGVEKAKQVYAGNNINYNPENDLLLGMYKDNDEVYAFAGKIAEIRIWKITRTQPEIQNNLSQRLTGNESGLVGYWPLNEGSNNIAHDRTSKTNHGVIYGANWEQSQVLFTMPSSPAPTNPTISNQPSSPAPTDSLSNQPSSPAPTDSLSNQPSSPAPTDSLSNQPSSPEPTDPVDELSSSPALTDPVDELSSSPEPTDPVDELSSSPALTDLVYELSSSPELNEPSMPSEEEEPVRLSEPAPEFAATGTKPDNPKTTLWIELKPARHQVAIYGQISDAETGLTIQNALVEITQMPETFKQWLILRSQQYGSQWQTLEHRPDRKRTAIDGYFHFLDLPDGEYTLTASLPSAGTCYGTAEIKAIVSRDSQGNYVKTAANMTLPPTAIKGKITDSGGVPIALAKIQIARTTDYIFSDSKGNYLFSSLETSKAPLKRTVNIQVSARGFQSASQSAELSQGAMENLNFVLKNS